MKKKITLTLILFLFVGQTAWSFDLLGLVKKMDDAARGFAEVIVHQYYLTPADKVGFDTEEEKEKFIEEQKVEAPRILEKMEREGKITEEEKNRSLQEILGTTNCNPITTKILSID